MGLRLEENLPCGTYVGHSVIFHHRDAYELINKINRLEAAQVDSICPCIPEYTTTKQASSVYYWKRQ